MRAKGMEEMDTYISSNQNTVTQYITTWPIFDLCLEVEQRSGSWVSRRWWDQGRMDLAGLC